MIKMIIIIGLIAIGIYLVQLFIWLVAIDYSSSFKTKKEARRFLIPFFPTLEVIMRIYYSYKNLPEDKK